MSNPDSADQTPPTIKNACARVWGGNRAADSELTLPGLRGWVLARPYQGQPAGGDVHFVSACGSGRITRAILLDVSGHGEPAVAVADTMRTLMQRYINHIEPNRLARDMNHTLTLDQRDVGHRFATAVIMTYFAPTGEMTLCNAGHPPPLIFRRSSGKWSALDQPDDDAGVSNLPLGLGEQTAYLGRAWVLEPGDLVVAYSDCLMEATNDAGEQLGVDGLAEVLGTITDAPTFDDPDGLADTLVKRIHEWGYGFDDDLTLIVLRCTERANGAGWRARVAGTWTILRRVMAGGPMPWPELTLRNLGGMVLPFLNR